MSDLQPQEHAVFFKFFDPDSNQHFADCIPVFAATREGAAKKVLGIILKKYPNADVDYCAA